MALEKMGMAGRHAKTGKGNTRVTVTLTSDLISKIIVYRAYLVHYLRKESQIWCVDASWDGGSSVMYLFGVTVTLNSDLVSRIIVSGAYNLLYYLR